VSKLLDDFRVDGTEYDVTGIVPENDYEYSVKAFMGDIVSEPSYPVWVDGITGLKVVSHEPSDVTKTSFTASWEPLGHATDYTISLSQVIAPEKDLEGVVVFEEDFDGITEGTVDNPRYRLDVAQGLRSCRLDRDLVVRHPARMGRRHDRHDRHALLARHGRSDLHARP